MTSKNKMRLGTAMSFFLLGGISAPAIAQDFGSFNFTFTEEQLAALNAYYNTPTIPTPPPPPPPSISPVIVAGGTTSLDITAQGTPIINISAPRADGTSYNVFSKLNVGAEGTIFNNRTTPGASQLGGTIVANPNIASTGMAATLILNEVTSGTRSDLLGTLEVAGAKAGLIIANPAGVTCDGCGFVNVSRATLSTGSPVFGAGGAFTGLNVVGGQVIVQGRGLSGTAPDYFDIVAGSTNVNAAINARDLLIAGAGQFGYTDRNIIVVNAAPNLTIDSSLLGGIYANRICIVGTSAGVGVNLQGLVQAYGGPISISAQGAVNLNNVTGAGDVAVHSEASTVKLGGALNAAGTAFITAKEDITFSNSTVNANNVFLDAGRNINFGTKTEPVIPVYDLGYDVSREDLYYNDLSGYGSNATLTTFNPYTYTNTVPVITTAKITAANIVSAYAGQNLTVNAGSSIKATNIGLTADNDVSILAESNLKSTSVRTNISGSYGYYGGAYGTKYYDQTITTEADVIGAEVNASGSLIFDAGRDINLIAALVNAGSNASLFASRDLVVGGLGSSKVLQRTYALNSSISGTSTEAFEEYDATSLSAGGNLTLRAGQELEVTGASVNSGGNLTGIAATGTAYVSGADVSALGNLYIVGNATKIIGSINNNSFDETVRKVKRGFLSKKTTTTVTSNAVQTVFASNLSGNNINLHSNTDVSILDANVAANNSVDIAAGGDIGIGSVTTDSSYYSSTKIKKSGFSFGGGGFFLGVSKSTNNVTTDVLSNAGSLIGAAEGTVRISAGAFGAGNGDLGIAGSRIAALENVVLAGDTVKIFNNIDSTTTATFFKSSSFGITRSFGSNLVNSANTIAALAKTASKTSNNRVQAVSLLAAGLAVKNGYDAAKQVVQSIKSGTGDLGITESISLGFNKTTASSLTIDENAVASQVVGGDIVILARGGVGQTGVSILGSDVTATRNLNIFSNSDVIIGAGTENDVFSGNSSSFGVSLGVSSSLSLSNGSVGFTPPTVSLGFNSSKSSYSGRDVTARPTILGAGAKATIDTLGTLLLEGSQLAANKVEVNAGSLNIISLQNTSDYISRSRNFGINITYNGSFGVNGSYGSTNYTGTFKAVQDLAGIRAGAGGFDLDVVSNTFLNGGVIASTAAASLNQLATGSIIARNINNYENYKASTVSFSASLGGGSTTGVSLGSLGNLNASIPTALSASGSQFSTTYSAVSPATVLLRSGDAASAAALAGLSRDTSLAFSPLTKEFTEAAREEIQQGFDATRQLVTETATFFANRATDEKKLRDAAKAKEDVANAGRYTDANGIVVILTIAQQEQLRTEAKTLVGQANDLKRNFGSGSAARILATAITGAAGANVTGSISSFAQAAVVNAVQSLAVSEIKKIADSLGQRTADNKLIKVNGEIIQTAKSEALRGALQALAACGGAVAGGSVNCTSAALGATASVALNLLLDAIDKKDRTADTNGDGYADSYTLEAEQARTNLIAMLTGILAQAVGANGSAAILAATIETENNQLAGLIACRTDQTGCVDTVTHPVFKNALIVYRLTEAEGLACVQNNQSAACPSRVRDQIAAGKREIEESGITLTDAQKRAVDGGDILVIATLVDDVRNRKFVDTVRSVDPAFAHKLSQQSPAVQKAVREDAANGVGNNPIGRVTGDLLSAVLSDDTIQDLYLANVSDRVGERRGGFDEALERGRANVARQANERRKAADDRAASMLATGVPRELVDAFLFKEYHNAAASEKLGQNILGQVQFLGDYFTDPARVAQGTIGSLAQGIDNVLLDDTSALDHLRRLRQNAADFANSDVRTQGTAVGNISGTGATVVLDVLVSRGAGRLTNGLGGPNIRVERINADNAVPGSPEYNLLNSPPPNTRIELSNGNVYVTNANGFVEYVEFQPRLVTQSRDGRQTAVGREGLNTDIGGHIQACSLGGTCDRVNLFPQNANFNNSGYKVMENELRRALQRGEDVGVVNVRFIRDNPNSPRPDRVEVTRTINGVTTTIPFRNQAGG